MDDVLIRITEDEGEYTVDIDAGLRTTSATFKTARAAEAYADKEAKKYGVEWCCNY